MADTANYITSKLLIAIPKRWPDCTCWRNNTGAGIGWSTVQGVIAKLNRGDIKGALEALKRPMSWGVVGSADILMVVGPHGRFGGIEVKAEGDHQSIEQCAWQSRILALGGFYVLATDVDLALEELRVAICGF